MNDNTNDETANTEHENGVSEEGPSDEIIELYREYIPEYLTEFHQAVSDNNEEQVMFHCHKMVSAMKIMKFNHIAELLETIQNENPKGERLNEIANKIEKYIEHTLILLKQ